MAVYNSLIDRGDASALMPEEYAKQIIKNVPQRSVVMQLARQLPNMNRAQQRLPILDTLLEAYFVAPTDTGKKQTGKVSWTNKYIHAEELAVIVPIPENVLADAEYDIFGEIRPLIEEAFGRAFDRAVFFGTTAPDSWPTNILEAATSAGNVVTAGGVDVDLYDDLLGDDGMLAKVETSGFDITGFVAPLSMRGKLRGVRTGEGVPIFVSSMQNGPNYMLDDRPILFPTNGSMDADQALMFGGDWSQLVYSIRQDITYKILTESVITDGNGVILHNLAQEDKIALRAVMRLGWEVPNPINAVKSVEAERYPFAAYLPKA